MEKKIMYTVVRYPKANATKAGQFAFNVYSKQHSDINKMREYRDELAIKHPDCHLVVVKRETAKQMRSVWHDYMENIGRRLSREDNRRSRWGQNKFTTFERRLLCTVNED